MPVIRFRVKIWRVLREVYFLLKKIDMGDKLYPEYLLGQLNPYGLRSKYIQGKNTQKRYPSLFNRYLNSDEIYARSADTDQNIIGAQAQLMGMFEDFNIQNHTLFNKDHAKNFM